MAPSVWITPVSLSVWPTLYVCKTSSSSPSWLLKAGEGADGTILCMEGLCYYWAIQAELLTSLTFARHCLSPLAAFTSGAYFLHNGRW